MGTSSGTVEQAKGGHPPKGGLLRTPRLRRKTRDAATGFLFVLPQLIGYTIFVAIPIVSVAWYSLHDWNLVQGNFDFIGLDNYGRMLSDPEMGDVAFATVAFTVGFVIVNVALGLALAIATHRPRRGGAIFRTIYFAPVVVSLVAWTLVFRFILQDQGVLNAALELVGIDGPIWLRETGPALFSLIAVQVLKTAGLSMVVFLGALQGIPPELREAAMVDGATDWDVFRRVTLPLITPFIFLVVVLCLIITVRSFALVDLLTAGGPGSSTRILSYYIYTQGFERFNIGYASSLAMVLMLVVLAVTAMQFAVRRRWSYLEEST